MTSPTTPRDDIGLSERLRQMPSSLNDACRTMEEAGAELDDYKRVALDRLDKLTKAEAHAKELEAAQTADRINHTSLCRSLTARATRAEQERDEAYERAAKVAEQFGEPYALNTNTGAMMFRAVTEKIAAAIRRLAAGDEKEK